MQYSNLQSGILSFSQLGKGEKRTPVTITMYLTSPVFMQERTIAGIPHLNQRWPPEKRKKGQFGPFLLQDCRLNTGITF